MAGKEFVGTTVISRNLERILGLFLYRYFQPHEGTVAETGLFRPTVVFQFVKFVAVGVIATVVDWGLVWILMNKAMWGHSLLRVKVGTWAIHHIVGGPLTEKAISDAAIPFLKVGPVLCAILTSYLLNRKARTFNHQAEKASLHEGLKFFVVAGTAAIFNVTFTSLAHRQLPGATDSTLMIANMAGMAAGFLINFTGQRVWTFRSKKPQLP